MKRKSINYATRAGRVKTTLWLDREVLNAVATEAGQRKVSKQSIMENSLKERYSEAGQLDRDAVSADRLNKLERSQRRLEHQNELSAEAHARFVRMWRYYLCYCEAAFLERAIGVVQVLWAKPESPLAIPGTGGV